MLHIDTRELHPGLIMSACRSSRARKRVKCGKRREGRRRGRRRWRRRRRRRSGRRGARGGEVEKSNKRCSLGCRAGLRCLSRSTSLPRAPRPPVPLFVVSDVPPSPPVLAEKERALGNPVLRSVASTLCVLLLLGCARSGVATVSVLSDLANGNYDRLEREAPKLTRDAIYIKNISTPENLTAGELWRASIVEANKRESKYHSAVSFNRYTLIYNFYL